MVRSQRLLSLLRDDASVASSELDSPPLSPPGLETKIGRTPPHRAARSRRAAIPRESPPPSDRQLNTETRVVADRLCLQASTVKRSTAEWASIRSIRLSAASTPSQVRAVSANRVRRSRAAQ